MKISMWMLANQLAFLEPTIRIGYDSPPVLRSARRVCATNCVHVYQDGEDCVCAWNQDTIRLSQIPVLEAFELVQSVFDSLEDWHIAVQVAAEEQDYQAVVDRCYQVFKNPVVLMDGNCKVLGISRRYGPDAIDEEWRHLKLYGCSSAKSLRNIRRDQSRNYISPSVVRFSFSEQFLKGSGMTIAILHGEELLGRINVMEVDHALNRGDMQFMEVVAAALRDSLTEHGEDAAAAQKPSVQRLLRGEAVPEADMRALEEVFQWDEREPYQVLLLRPKHPELLDDEDRRQMRNAACVSVTHLLQDDQVIVLDGDVVVVCNAASGSFSSRLNRLQALTVPNDIAVAHSLPVCGLANLHALLSQARAAFTWGIRCHPEQPIFDFYQYGIDYLLENPADTEEYLLACQPDVLLLARRADGGDDGSYETLRQFLLNERSVQQTAERMYLHRNTMVYRVRKLTELLQYDLDDSYTREYMRVSFHALELYHKRARACGAR